jgi:tetratricopeptide (TPR) repeat protein
VCGLLASTAHADDPGQKDLDEAIAAKLSADTFRSLGEVADLCQKALEAGLSETNAEFAKKLMAGVLLERASAVCAPILGGAQPDAQWPFRRRVALEDLRRAIDCDPNQPMAQVLLAQLQMLPGGNREQALAALDVAIQTTTDDKELCAEAHRLRAGLRMTVAERMADLDRAAELSPSDPKPLRDRGELRLSQNQPAEALADFDAAIALEPNDAATHGARGMAQGMLQQWDDARESFSRAASLAPGSTMPLVQRGRINYLAGDLDAALADAAAALEIDPNDVPALLFRSQLLGANGKFDEALADINRALEARPGFVEGLRIWASLIVMSGKVSETVKALEKHSRRRPNDVIAFVRLGLLYSGERQNQQAIDAFTSALRLERNVPFAYQARGDAYLNIGKQSEAIADYESALQRDPDNSGVLNNLAWVLATSPDAELRDGTRAVELATKACELTGYGQAHILSTLAAGYAEQGDFETAQRWSRQSLDVSDEETKSQLSKELASYEAQQPWRELQSETEQPADTQPPREAKKDAPAPR